MSRGGRIDPRTGRAYVPDWSGLTTPPIVGVEGRPMPGTAPIRAERPQHPPRPWGGNWGPSEQDLLRWGATGELIEADPGQPELIPKATVGLVDFHFPVPVTVVLMLSAAWLSPAAGAWSNIIVFEVDPGIGRSTNPLTAVVPPGGLSQNPPLPPFFTQQAPISASGVLVPCRDLRIGARMYSQPNQTPGARWMVSASIAMLGA